MTRKQFIKKLRKYLSPIDPEEMEDVIDYYNEYLDDANIYEDDEVPEGMDPKKIAGHIFSNTKFTRKNIKNPLEILGIILIGLISLPIAIPILAIVFVALIFVIVFLGLFIFIPSVFMYSLFTIPISNTMIGFVGIFLIKFALIVFCLLIIYYILKLIVLGILSLFWKINRKNNQNYDNIYIYKSSKSDSKVFYDKLTSINFPNLISDIRIEKSDYNSVTVYDEYNYDYNDGNLTITMKDNGIRNALVIKYKDNIDLNAEKIVGQIKFDLPDKTNSNLKNVVGNIELYTSMKKYKLQYWCCCWF